MTKETFVKLIKELVEIKKDVDKLNEALKKFEPDFNFISFGRYESLVVEALGEAMNDKADWIGYWLYELGGERKNSEVTYNGKKIPMKTPEDLYNCIKL